MNGMRALLAAVIIMGVLILVGSAAIIAKIMGGFSQIGSMRPPVALTLHERPGAHIETIAGVGNDLALLLADNGTSRVVIIDPRTQKVVLRLGLSAAGNAPDAAH